MSKKKIKKIKQPLTTAEALLKNAQLYLKACENGSSAVEAEQTLRQAWCMVELICKNNEIVWDVKSCLAYISSCKEGLRPLVRHSNSVGQNYTIPSLRISGGVSSAEIAVINATIPLFDTKGREKTGLLTLTVIGQAYVEIFKL